MTELNESLNAPAAAPRSTPPRLSLYRRLAWAGAFLALLIVAVLVGLWFLPPQLNGLQLQSPRVAEDFTLPSSTGETLSLSDYRGKYVVLVFGYTFCPDVCPTTLNDVQQMLTALGDRRADDVQVIMVSVDPERDTPEQLATYLNYFNPNFVGMTGTVEEIQPVASQFGIFFERQPGSSNTSYLVDHSAAVTVIDPEGYVRMIWTYGITGQEMASDLGYLMRRW